MDIALKEHISDVLGEVILGASPMTGGDINHAVKVETKQDIYFVKWNDIPQSLAMLESEAFALQSLQNTQTIGIPNIIAVSSFENKAYLILQFIHSKQKPDSRDLVNFGRHLAKLHLVPTDYFGYPEDNFIGRLTQVNLKSDNWSEFYIKHRLHPQIATAKNSNHLSNISAESIDRLYVKIDALLKDTIPSLLHGDLWSGNYIIANNGQSYLIDPASYYGHAEVDLAMSELFGGFGEDFYIGYNDVKKISANYTHRREIYQLYYLLVHLNLFGRSYEESCARILRKFN